MFTEIYVAHITIATGEQQSIQRLNLRMEKREEAKGNIKFLGRCEDSKSGGKIKCSKQMILMTLMFGKLENIL